MGNWLIVDLYYIIEERIIKKGFDIFYLLLVFKSGLNMKYVFILL